MLGDGVVLLHPLRKEFVVVAVVPLAVAMTAVIAAALAAMVPAHRVLTAGPLAKTNSSRGITDSPLPPVWGPRKNFALKPEIAHPGIFLLGSKTHTMRVLGCRNGTAGLLSSLMAHAGYANISEIASAGLVATIKVDLFRNLTSVGLFHRSPRIDLGPLPAMCVVEVGKRRTCWKHDKSDLVMWSHGQIARSELNGWLSCMHVNLEQTGAWQTFEVSLRPNAEQFKVPA